MAVVTALITYPVKGCAGIRLSASELTPAGLAHDRSFMIVGPDGVSRSQRGYPRLAGIRPAVDPGGRRLTLAADGTEPIDIDVEFDGPRRPVILRGEGYHGIDQGDPAARWLTAVLGERSRLVRVPVDHHRRTDGLTPGTSGYADSCPVHLISESSLDDLNRRIRARGGQEVPMSRFRPNVVVGGWVRPHQEDLAWRITVGTAELGFAKAAIRCAVTTVDQDTGAKTGPEPLKTLATYRRAAEGGLTFGAKFAVLAAGRLAVGDQCDITIRQSGALAEHVRPSK